jgi:hypothetical protein
MHRKISWSAGRLSGAAGCGLFLECIIANNVQQYMIEGHVRMINAMLMLNCTDAFDALIEPRKNFLSPLFKYKYRNMSA